MSGLRYIRSQIINKTMDELAIMLNVSKQAIYTWESGRKSIPDKRLKELSTLSGVPEQYFKKEELTDRDKLEIKRCHLNKQIDDTRVEYEDVVQGENGEWVTISREHYDTGLLQHAEFNDENLRINDTLKKISSIIDNADECNTEINSFADMINARETKRTLFDKFADIVDGNDRTDYLYPILRAMNLWFSGNVKTESMEGEAIMVQELLTVFANHEKRVNEEIEELKKLGMID